MSKKQITITEFASLGGKARYKNAGTEGMSEIGKKGGNKLLEKYGADHFKKIRRIGIEKKKRQNSPVRKYANLLTGGKQG